MLRTPCVCMYTADPDAEQRASQGDSRGFQVGGDGGRETVLLQEQRGPQTADDKPNAVQAQQAGSAGPFLGRGHRGAVK